MNADKEKYRKLVLFSLAGLLIGSLLFIFGISIQTTLVPLLIHYIIAIVLYISSFLALYNNYKIYPAYVFKYIMILTVFLAIFITYATISKFI